MKHPKNLLVALLYNLASSKLSAIVVIVLGFAVSCVLVWIVTGINAQPIDSMMFLNTVFLMFQRPIFVCAISLAFAPILLRNPLTYPITAMFEHSFWFPLARLSYGAYLSAGIFMLFRTYNMERGLWACEIDSFFFFMAYLSFAYLFSFIITMLVELPCLNLFDTFILGNDREVYLRGPASQLQNKSKKVASSRRIGGRSLSDESCESDAETLDKPEDGEEARKPTLVAAYSKGRSDLVLDPEEAPSRDKRAKGSVSFPEAKKSVPPPRQKPAPASAKRDSPLKQPLLPSA